MGLGGWWMLAGGLVACAPSPVPHDPSTAPVAQPAPTPPAAPAASPANAVVEPPAPTAAVEPGAAATPEEPPTPEPAVVDDGKTRVWAPDGLVRIYEKPDRDGSVIGAFRAGQGVVVTDARMTAEREAKKLYKCTSGWYPVEPRGWVCVGGEGHATLDAHHPSVVAARAALPNVHADYPYKYGTSVGAPRYLRIPTKAEQHHAEPGLDAYLTAFPAPTDLGAIDLTKAGRGPSQDFLRYQATAKPELMHEQEAYEGYKIAWVNEFDAEGRTWLLTADMTLVPKDKVRQKALPTFRGVDLRERSDLRFPMGFFWLDDTPKWKKGEDGNLYQTDEVYPRHAFVNATLEQARGPGGIYWKMDDGGFVKFRDVSIIREADAVPGGVGDGKWVDIRITWGYLVAYEGAKPVYVTAISPGVDGIAKKGHSTALGKQYIDWKLITGDMSGRDGKKDWFIDEVPWVQYYKGNFALHGAFWHDDFGRPKSHGCVNLAPADARRIFAWMDPVVPEGWYAASTIGPKVQGTMLIIRP